MCPIVGKKRRRETKRKKGAICTEWASRGGREEDVYCHTFRANRTAAPIERDERRDKASRYWCMV